MYWDFIKIFITAILSSLLSLYVGLKVANNVFIKNKKQNEDLKINELKSNVVWICERLKTFAMGVETCYINHVYHRVMYLMHDNDISEEIKKDHKQYSQYNFELNTKYSEQYFVLFPDLIKGISDLQPYLTEEEMKSIFKQLNELNKMKPFKSIEPNKYMGLNKDELNTVYQNDLINTTSNVNKNIGKYLNPIILMFKPKFYYFKE